MTLIYVWFYSDAACNFAVTILDHLLLYYCLLFALLFELFLEKRLFWFLEILKFCHCEMYTSAAINNRPRKHKMFTQLPARAGSMLAHRLRHCTSIEPTLGDRIVLVGVALHQ